MISFFSWCTLAFFICNVWETQSVKIFRNLKATVIPPRYDFKPSVKSKTCLLNPEQGPCRSRIKMLYFDPEINNCSIFEWGGCQGNGNRFTSYRACLDTCMTKESDLYAKKIPRYCQLTFDYGFCFGAIPRYYYDKLWKVCKSTIYSGCGGNKNNFYSIEQCENVCQFGIGPISNRKRTRAPGEKRKVVIINPLDKSEIRKATMNSSDASKPCGEGSPTPASTAV